MDDWFQDVLHFLADHEAIYSFQLTAIFNELPWKKVPLEWITALSLLDTSALNDVPFEPDKDQLPHSLVKFIAATHCLSLPRGFCAPETCVELTREERRGMNPKKQHEVEQMCAEVRWLAGRHRCRDVIDVGSGLGYLGGMLSRKFGFKVCGLESEDSRTEGAQTRSGKTSSNKDLMSHVTFCLKDEESSYDEFTLLVRDLKRRDDSQADTHPTRSCGGDREEICMCDSQYKPAESCQHQSEQLHTPTVGYCKTGTETSDDGDHITRSSERYDTQPEQPETQQRSGCQNDTKKKVDCPDTRMTKPVPNCEIKTKPCHQRTNEPVNDRNSETDSRCFRNHNSKVCADKITIDKPCDSLLSDDRLNHDNAEIAGVLSGDGVVCSGCECETFDQRNARKMPHFLTRWQTSDLGSRCEGHKQGKRGRMEQERSGQRSSAGEGGKLWSEKELGQRSELRRQMSSDGGVCMTGLHCCGDLTPIMLKYFVRCPDLRCLLCFGCCYHNMTRSASGDFHQFPLSESLKRVMSSVTATRSSPLNVFALRLAAQETRSRWRCQSAEDHDFHTKNVAFRGLLEIFCQQEGVSVSRERRRLAHKSDYTSLEQYTRTVHGRLNMDKPLDFVDARMRALYEEHRESVKYIEPLTCLQVLLQPVLESLVIMDRVAFLEEHGLKAQALPVFDEQLSPRNIAIVACKC